MLETHELDSALARERGEAAEPWQALEERAVQAADVLVANCEGTLAMWRDAYTLPPSIALHNATRQDRVRSPNDTATGIGYVRR